MRLTLFMLPALVALLGACNQFPELDHTVDSDAQAAGYTDLVPIETIKAAVPETQIEPKTEEDLEDRVERLKKRANGLRGAVVDEATQERMRAGIEPGSE